MSLGKIGAVLILLIVIYFLFRFGQAIAQDSFSNPFIAWFVALFLLLSGYDLLDQENPAGFMGFIPVVTYIFMKIADGVNLGGIIKKRVEAAILSAIASSIVYVITQHFFNFGVTEASVGAVMAAAILGIAGYTTT
jgi:hypothetical protein